MIKMIIASTKDGLIGNENHLPWHIPEELQFFKKTTINHHLLWGRKTFVNLPKKLSNRTHYVLSTLNQIENANYILHNLQQVNNLLQKFKFSTETLFICGGKTIYQQFYQMADEIFWTEIKNNFKGNIYLKLDLSNYVKTKIFENDKFTIYKYVKINEKN